MSTPNEERFAALAEPIQDALLNVTRVVIGMDAEEKEDASIYCHALSHTNNPEDSTVLLLHAVEAVVHRADSVAEGGVI